MIASHIEKQVDLMMAAMLPALLDTPELREVPPEARTMLTDITREVMRDTFTPKLVERMTPVYASIFTESELEGIVAFYESPAG